MIHDLELAATALALWFGLGVLTAMTWALVKALAERGQS